MSHCHLFAKVRFILKATYQKNSAVALTIDKYLREMHEVCHMPPNHFEHSGVSQVLTALVSSRDTGSGQQEKRKQQRIDEWDSEIEEFTIDADIIYESQHERHPQRRLHSWQQGPSLGIDLGLIRMIVLIILRWRTKQVQGRTPANSYSGAAKV